MILTDKHTYFIKIAKNGCGLHLFVNGIEEGEEWKKKKKLSKLDASTLSIHLIHIETVECRIIPVWMKTNQMYTRSVDGDLDDEFIFGTP